MPRLYIANELLKVPATEPAIRITDDADGDTLRIDAFGKFQAGNITNGTIGLPLQTARLVAFGAIAVSGGVLATDTNPSIARRNGATDPGARISWAAGNAAAIRIDATVPDDLNPNAAGTLTVTGSMAGSSDTPVLTANVFVGIGGTDLGGATAAFSSATQTLTVTLASWPSGAAGQPIVIILTPGTHATDILRLDAARVRYSRM